MTDKAAEGFHVRLHGSLILRRRKAKTVVGGDREGQTPCGKIKYSQLLPISHNGVTLLRYLSLGFVSGARTAAPSRQGSSGSIVTMGCRCPALRRVVATELGQGYRNGQRRRELGLFTYLQDEKPRQHKTK